MWRGYGEKSRLLDQLKQLQLENVSQDVFPWTSLRLDGRNEVGIIGVLIVERAKR